MLATVRRLLSATFTYYKASIQIWENLMNQKIKIITEKSTNPYFDATKSAL